MMTEPEVKNAKIESTRTLEELKESIQ